jgi:CRISPR-associated protein Csx14
MSTLLATLGGQPQVVTFALDALLEDHPISDVIVLYLPSEDGRAARALDRLAAEFAGGRYAGRSMRFEALPIRLDGRVLADIRDEAGADAVWEMVYALVGRLKDERRTLHVCISGGRRILGLLTMSAAMLHFGHQDALWHMYTPPALRAAAEEGALLHAPPGSGFRLFRVPIMPWGSYFPALQELARPAGGDVLARPRQMFDSVERARCRAVIDRLTPRQTEVLRLLAEGRHPRVAADLLNVELSTLDSHKTVILAECRNVWGLPEEVWLDYRFLREKFEPFFAAL